MKIGIDLHGVLTHKVELFRPLLELMKKSGAIIFIMSGPPEKDVQEKLSNLGYKKDIHYDEILSITDYLRSKGVKMWLDHKNTWWSSEEEWWKSKGELCRICDIDLLIDDSIEYKKYLDDGTLFMLLANDVRPISQPTHEKYLTDKKEVDNYKKAREDN